MTAPALARPVLVTAADACAEAILDGFRTTSPDLLPWLAFSAVAPPPSGATSGGATHDDLMAQVIQQFEFRQGRIPDKVSWLVVLGTDSVREGDTTFGRVVDVAAELWRAGRELVLNVVLLEQGEPGLSGALETLVAEVARQKAQGYASVFLIRQRIARGFENTSDDVASLAGVVLRGLVLAQSTGVDPDLWNSVALPTGEDIGPTEPSALGIIKRPAGARLRVAWVPAARFAAIAAFVRLLPAPTGAGRGLEPQDPRLMDLEARIPVGWRAPALSEPVSPGSGREDRPTITGDRTGGLPDLTLPRPPWMQDDDRWMDDTVGSAAGWVDKTDEWQQRVRVGFTADTRDIRVTAALERDRAVEEAVDRFVGIWADHAQPHPASLMVEAARVWGEQLSVVAEGEAAKLEVSRELTASGVASSVNDLLSDLRIAFEDRPRFGVMYAFALAAIISGTAMAWPFGSSISGLPIVGDLLPGWSLAYAALLLFLVLPFVLLLGVAFRSRLQVESRLLELEQFTRSQSSRLEEDLTSEMNLVETHWHLKTLASLRREVLKLRARVVEAARRVQDVEVPSVDVAKPSRFEPWVPDVTGASQMLKTDGPAWGDLVADVRSEAVGHDLVAMDYEEWETATLERLFDAFHEAFKARQSAGFRGALQSAFRTWEKQSADLLAQGSAERTGRAAAFVLASEDAAEAARTAIKDLETAGQDLEGEAAHEVPLEVHVVPLQGEEILLLRVLSGLNATSALS